MKNEKLKKFFAKKSAKGIALLLAVVLIGVAVFANYKLFYDNVGSLGFGEGNMEDGGDGSNQTDAEEENDYFSATALSRQQSRDEAIEVLKAVTQSEEASKEAKEKAQSEISKIAVDIQNEANIETLVKAKGFEDCVAVISDGSVSVIVSADKLVASEAAQILSIVRDTTGISPEKVSIINK